MARAGEARIDKVAVIGAGPGGLAAAKYLVAEKAFSEIVVFEQRLSVGGLWNATPTIAKDKHFTVPQTSPNTVPDEPIWDGVAGADNSSFRFISPIYDNLDSNLPQTLMQYSDHRFPEGTPLFPLHHTILEYLERYADEVRDLIKFGTQVLDVRPTIEDGSRERWSVTTRHIKSGQRAVQIFDAVIVASGHYDSPYVPDLPGIREWFAAYPNSISHSKFYRKPGGFKDSKVLIVGISASGADLAAQIAPICKAPLLISSRSPLPPELSSSLPDSLHSLLPEIARFNYLDRTIHFTNNHAETDVDHVIFCTGYLYSFPFLQSLSPPVISVSPDEIPGMYVPNLYQHIFYYPAPTLSFIAIPQRVVPFPLSEAQSSVIARFLSGRLTLASPSAMKEWEENFIARVRGTETSRADEAGEVDQVRGLGGLGIMEIKNKVHVLGYPADAEYLNFLHGWALKASPMPAQPISPRYDGGLTGEEGQNLNREKEPPFWGDESCWMRKRCPEIKKKARELGPTRRGGVKTLADLGLYFTKEKENCNGILNPGY